MSAPILYLFQAARKPDGRLPVSYLKILFLHSPPLKLSYDIALTEGVIVLVLTSLLYQPLKEIPAPPQYRIRNNTVNSPGRVVEVVATSIGRKAANPRPDRTLRTLPRFTGYHNK